MSLRVRFIQKMIAANEAIFFYPKLKKFYADNLKNKSVAIIDVGANKGQSISFFLKIFAKAKINSFEPNKKLYIELKKKYKSNSNVVVHNLGVSNIKGELLFHENIMDETSTFETLNPDSQYLRKKARTLGVATDKIVTDNYKVSVTRLIDFLNDHPGDFFDILKIDVEGHELQCLQGLFENYKTMPVRYIQLESHNDDMYLNNDHQSIEALLQANGFGEATRIKHGFGDFYEIIYERKDIK